MWSLRWMPLVALLSGCGSCGSVLGSEGDQDGECNDALDNDGDDLYDCDDPDCAEYWECLPDTGPVEGPYDYEAFSEDMLQAACDKMEECAFFTDYFTYDDCRALGDVEDTGGHEWVCEGYDTRAAQACVEEWINVSCDDFLAGIGLDVCDDVCRND